MAQAGEGMAATKHVQSGAVGQAGQQNMGSPIACTPSCASPGVHAWPPQPSTQVHRATAHLRQQAVLLIASKALLLLTLLLLLPRVHVIAVLPRLWGTLPSFPAAAARLIIHPLQGLRTLRDRRSSGACKPGT